jgi:YidC/Oxa1 family membrane protein insertase
MGSEQKRVMLAVLLSGVVLFGWQVFFAPKAPVKTNVHTEIAKSNQEEQQAKDGEAVTTAPSQEVVVSTNTKTTVELKNNDHVFRFSNDLSVENIENKNAVFDFSSIAGSKLPFQIFLMAGAREIPLYFDLKEGSVETEITGENLEHNITLHAILLENGKLDFNLKSASPYFYRFKFFSEKEEKENQLARQFIVLKTDIDRIAVGESESGDGSVKWFGIDYNYHLFALVLGETTKARYFASKDGTFTLDTVEPMNNFVGDLVFTKKNYDDLVALGDKLDLSVDFGFFGIIAVPILRGLQFFYDLIPNYGIAIILLTILIRFILFPLQWKSFKSMKKMQVLSPELQKLREKFKDDPQRMQKETMDLFKRSGANPLGGCLPLLMQMPIFFAFYQVLYNAVELVGAPFAWWIVDLSIKDPYYVLPILMGISMVGQQKLTPTATMDATQRRIMMIMPLVFTFIMKDLPAGLNLYIFVSTVFGIVQQLIVYRTTE